LKTRMLKEKNLIFLFADSLTLHKYNYNFYFFSIYI